MPNVPEIQSEAMKWQRRIGMLSQAGLNPSVGQQLARTDLQRIMKGGSALPEEEVTSMVHAAYTGQTNTPQNKGGDDWNPLHIVGNAMKDITTDVRELPAVFLSQAKDLVSPEKWGQLGSDIEHFKLGSIGYMAKEIAAMPELPALSLLVPGAPGEIIGGMYAASLAGSLSPSDLAKHPLNSALAVSGVVSEGLKLSSGLGVMGEAAQAGTGLEALQKGHPFEAISKFPLTGGSLHDRFQETLKKSELGNGPVWKAYNALGRTSSRKLRDNYLNEIQRLFPNASQEELHQLAIDALTYNDRFLTESSTLQKLLRDVGSQPGTVDLRGIIEHAKNTKQDITVFVEQGLEWSKDKNKVYVSPQSAEANGVSEDMLVQARVQPDNLKFEGGEFYGSDLLPNKTYKPEYASTLDRVRKISDKTNPEKLYKDTVTSVVMPGTTKGEIELYPTSSVPAKKQLDLHATASKLNTVRTRTITAEGKLKAAQEEADRLVRRTQTGKSAEEAAKNPKTVAAFQRKQEQIAQLQENVQKLHQEQNLLERRRAAQQKELHKALKKDPPPRYTYLREQTLKSRLKAKSLAELRKAQRQAESAAVVNGTTIVAIREQIKQAYVDLVVKIDKASTHEELSKIVGEKTFKAVEKTVTNDIADYINAGYDPILLHSIDTEYAESKVYGEVKPLSSHMTSQDVHRMFDFKPGVLDIKMMLTHQAVTYAETEAGKRFYDFLQNRSGVAHKQEDVEKDLARRYPDDAALIANHLKSDYVTWKNPFDKTDTEYLIPRGVHKGLQKLHGGDHKVPLKIRQAHQTLLRTFMLSALTGPRHLVHVGIGGLVMVALDNPGSLAEAGNAYSLVRALRRGEKIPSQLHDLEAQIKEGVESGQIFKGQYETPMDQLWAWHSGSTVGNWMAQHLGGPKAVLRHLDNFESTLSDMHRTTVYLKDLKSGVANEEALAHANKVIIDVDNMTPFERTTVKQFFPFYSFTKHILRYVLSYPGDHPLKASILANLSQHIEDDASSGDPGRLSKLFFLGSPDPTGKVNAVDLSNLNPFRSMSSIFSMGGFMSGLLPEGQLILRGLGINTLTGTPYAHTNLTYDAYQGKMEPTRPKVDLFNWASTFIPQADLVNHFAMLTDNMRSLKASNPEAYQRQFWQSLNMPFTVAPINIYDVRAKAAQAQYQMASSAVAAAFRSGNTDALRQYQAVPWQGYLFDGNQVANYIDHYDKLYPGVSPKAVMTKPKLPKKKAVLG